MLSVVFKILKCASHLGIGLAHVGGLPASALGAVESMIRPVSRLASDSTPPALLAGCAPWEGQWQKNTRPGERA